MINAKVERLAFAIKTAEGWLPEKNSLTFRNHNPGALRSSRFAIGERDNFAYFLSDDVGFVALCFDLAMKCQGKTATGLRPISTLYDLIKVYTAETDPQKLENYTLVIEKITGLSRNIELNYFN